MHKNVCNAVARLLEEKERNLTLHEMFHNTTYTNGRLMKYSRMGPLNISALHNIIMNDKERRFVKMPDPKGGPSLYSLKED